MDIMQREGRYPLPPGAPSTLGVEFSGHVVQAGEGVNEWKEGDEVLGLASGVRIFLNSLPCRVFSHTISRAHTPNLSLHLIGTSSRSPLIYHGLTQQAFQKCSSQVIIILLSVHRVPQDRVDISVKQFVRKTISMNIFSDVR